MKAASRKMTDAKGDLDSRTRWPPPSIAPHSPPRTPGPAPRSGRIPAAHPATEREGRAVAPDGRPGVRRLPAVRHPRRAPASLRPVALALQSHPGAHRGRDPGADPPPWAPGVPHVRREAAPVPVCLARRLPNGVAGRGQWAGQGGSRASPMLIARTLSRLRPALRVWAGGRSSPSRSLLLRRRTDRPHRTRAPKRSLRAASRASPGPLPF